MNDRAPRFCGPASSEDRGPTSPEIQKMTEGDEWFIFQQIGLPDKMYKVIEHRARKYIDPVTGRIHITPLPEVIRKGGLLGADMAAFVSYMKGACHMSYTTIQQFFSQVVKLNLCRGMLCKATQKVSDALGPSYDELADRLPHEPRVNVDETGHHDDGKLHWAWCFDTAKYSLFTIDPSRGCGVLERMLTEVFAGIIGADYWGAYRKFARLFDIRVQYCMAHLIREIRFLAQQKIKRLSRLINCFDVYGLGSPLCTILGWCNSSDFTPCVIPDLIRNPVFSIWIPAGVYPVLDTGQE